jgi:hypothetical protein
MLVAALLVPVLTFGDEERVEAIPGANKVPLSALPYSSDARSREDLLARNKFVIAEPTYRQVFEAYVVDRKVGALPYFITSDSILNGYHVLYEESIVRLEQANALALRRGLSAVWQQLKKESRLFPGDLKLLEAARRRAQVVVGTALVLGGEKAGGAGDAVTAQIAAETEKVIAAKGPAVLDWLTTEPAEKQAKVDYRRMKPRGFYTRSQRLSGYFRATSYLQSVPFYFDQDEDLVAVMLVGEGLQLRDNVFHGKSENNPFLVRLDQIFQQLVGPRADPGLIDLEDMVENKEWDLSKDDLKTIRDHLRGRLLSIGETRTRDLANGADEAPRIAIRVMPARMVPEAPMFAATTDPRNIPNRAMPSGLEVGVAIGSTHAEGLQQGKSWEAVVERIKNNHRDLANEHSPGIYPVYLATLAALLADAEHDVPPFMHGDAWKTKQVQTALAGWAQLRHTWQLQAKESMSLFGGPPKTSGFVEPVPEFYSRLGALAAETRELMIKYDALGPNLDKIAERLRAAIAALEKANISKRGAKGWKSLPGEIKGAVSWYSVESHWTKEEMNDADWEKLAIACLPEWKAQLAQVEAGQKPGDVTVEVFGSTGDDLRRPWDLLIETCRSLELLSHKQLRGVDFSDREKKIIEDYGKTLGTIMLHEGDAFLTPRDTAPRIADVHLSAATGEVLEVGIGRPKSIYVLYPWKGKEVLCRGAVLPYYEFSSKERLTDEQWLKKLDRADAPALPVWTGRIVAQPAGKSD